MKPSALFRAGRLRMRFFEERLGGHDIFNKRRRCRRAPSLDQQKAVAALHGDIQPTTADRITSWEVI